MLGLSNRTAARAGPFLPAAIVLALWLVGAHLSGGYFARDWYPAGVALVVLAAVVALAGERAVPQNRAARTALLIFAALVVWSYLSILWAGSPGSAWEASNKLLVYLVGAWLLALLPWTRDSAAIFLGSWSVGIAVVFAISLLGAVDAAEFSEYLYASRYQDPVGYTNANAALAIMAALPALALSYQRRLAPVAQGALLATATFLVEFSLLTQSRAAALGGIIIAVLFVAAAPERLRLAGRLAILAGAVGLAAPALLDVYSTARAGESVKPAIEHAALQMAWTTALAALAGAGLAVLERSFHIPGSGRRLRVMQVGAGVLIVLAAGTLIGTQGGRAIDYIDAEFEAADGNEAGPGEDRTRYTKTTLYERPDYWRASLDMFAERPVAGFGSGNFERQYSARREEPKYSRFAHNVWMRALAEWGVVGFGLLAAFVLFVFIVPLSRLRRIDVEARGVVVGCLAVTAYFFIHASFDWLEEVPALAAPAVALAAVAIAVGRPELRRADDDVGRRGPGRMPAVAATVALAILGLLVLVPPYLSQRYVDQASSGWEADPAEAFDDLDRAAALNPLSSTPRVTEGTIAVSLERAGRARRAFREALEIEDGWYPRMELALLDSQQGRRTAALAQISRAKRLSSMDPFLEEAERRIREGERLDASEFNAGIARQTREAFVTQQE